MQVHCTIPNLVDQEFIFVNLFRVWEEQLTSHIHEDHPVMEAQLMDILRERIQEPRKGPSVPRSGKSEEDNDWPCQY